MKPGHWLALGSATAGCTAALAIYLAAKGSTPAGHPPQAGVPRPQAAPAVKRQFTPTSAKPASSRAVQISAADAPRRESGESAPGFQIHGKPPAGRVANEREWFANAEKIERQANRELARLRETLELTPNQQQRIFDVLARNSPSWMPGMLTGGSHGVGLIGDVAQPSTVSGETASESIASTDGGELLAASLVEEIMPILDEEQQQAMIDDEIDRRAWWEEILPQLLPPEFPVAAGADDPAASLPGNGDTKAYQGPTELLEE